MRDASTYRGARRNAFRGSVWGSPECYYEGVRPTLIRRSYTSKKASKYMPHDGGKRYKETKKPALSKKAIVSLSASILGMPFRRFR